jgi:hypothetical protein
MRRFASAGQTSSADGRGPLYSVRRRCQKRPKAAFARTLSELLGWGLARENERWRNLQASSSLVQVESHRGRLRSKGEKTPCAGPVNPVS